MFQSRGDEDCAARLESGLTHLPVAQLRTAHLGHRLPERLRWCRLYSAAGERVAPGSPATHPGLSLLASLLP
eukprot:scaffold1085_cov407-Prasinococcus_capsulatus_cf.AAC.87